MNKLEKKFFELLHKDRADSADIFEKPANRGLWRSVVEKYSDQAHFIYELIQNADDAGATTARFVLENDRLIFAHNGTRHFSISNPLNEGDDAENGYLGDINSITGIAFSNKPEQENKIGKFGVGFKAVFQYTASPHIYDPNFCFRIDRYIVPSILEEDFVGRKADETLFVFPFNHRDKTVQETYNDILGKLKALSYPILFLSNLLDISFEIGNTVGLYGKSISETRKYDENTIAERISLSQNYGDDIVSNDLWLFTRMQNGLKYSVGYFINEKNQLIPVNEPAFCFFPTKENTGLNFIIHAPFLLTDSREGIKAGEKHNNTLIDLLAKLAGESLLYLKEIGDEKKQRIIDDNILSIVPVNEEEFCELDDVSSISFKPFYTEIKHIFETQKIIPTRSGYVEKSNAYWAAVPFLAELFSDEQLAKICGNQNAKWAFVSLGRDEIQRSTPSRFNYINSIVLTSLTEQHLIKGRYVSYYPRRKDVDGITEAFIENQSIEWLFKFYKWMSETSGRIEFAKEAPIFLDRELKAASAYDANGHMLLFLPNEDIPNCRTIHEKLLKNEDARILIEKVGITIPSIRDEIYNVIVPMYKNDEDDIDIDAHFKILFKYYKQCPQEEVDDFLDEIRNCEFITCIKASDPIFYRSKAKELYLPTDELLKYFEASPETYFIALDEYKTLFGKSEEKNLVSFFTDLGAKTQPSVLEESDWGYYQGYTEYYVDGLKDFIEKVVSNKSPDLSCRLWNYLCDFLHENILSDRVKRKVVRTRPDGRYNWRNTFCESSTLNMLRTLPWLMNANGEFVNSHDLTRYTLSKSYDMTINSVNELIELLELTSKDVEKEDDSKLTDTQREKVLFAERLLKMGITEEDAVELVRIKKEREVKALISEEESVTKTDDVSTQEIIPTRKLHKTTSRVAQDILNRTHNTPIAHTDFYEDENIDTDSDEYMPTLVDYSRKTELAKEKAAREIDKIAYQEELQQKALDAEKYSYGWFKALLELETLNSNTNALNSKEVSISFARVERDPGTQRTLVLKQPNRYIPQFMEDLADIPLVLHFGDQTKTLAIEVANVKSYTLRVKLKSHVDISEIDFSKVTEARIDAQSPVFLLEELRKQINALSEEFGYEDSFNMQENLCENIEFVFGPPGTGKTTYLAKNVIMPLMSGTEEPKVLVLTPTNKSADVLARRIMEVMGDDTTYNDWLVRFGGTGDETIEDSPIFRDKSFDIRTLNKNVTITTIARFPYDFFMPQGARIFLNGIKWDYIIIDEASMIPLVNMIYPLYKKTPKKFIIAGDPFQIEPITSVDLWRNENIYTMVKLDSFENPSTIPHDYKVELLTTQYRSIPSVGSVFSKFAYGGILEHYRKESDRKPLNIGDTLKIEPLNLIKFPVSKYESIYRCKRLQHSSSYQIYSALFTFEFAHYMAKKIASTNVNSIFRIGIIAPYRAQADLIDKLICSKKIPANIDIQVGTIHGFQGDECDAIFVVLNTPPSISASKEMFLNKRNIINVAISRAKDYLFLIMPDDDTENIQNLRLVKRVEQLAKSIGCYTEVKSPEIENLMFGSSTYFEDNAFSTGHQSVNVYGLPEKRYEIRSEDTAVDIQIHRSRKESASENMTLNKGDKQNVLSNVSTKTITNGRAYQAGDNIKGKRISLHIGDGEIIQGIVLDDRSNIISVQHTDDKGNRVVEKFKIDISTRKKRIRIFE